MLYSFEASSSTEYNASVKTMTLITNYSYDESVPLVLTVT